jgi:hypothetical protein
MALNFQEAETCEARIQRACDKKFPKLDKWKRSDPDSLKLPDTAPLPSPLI